MDIRSCAVNPTAKLLLRDAGNNLIIDEQGRQLAVTVYGPGSKQFAKAQAIQSNAMMNKLKRNGDVEDSEEILLQEKAEYLANCTESFENVDMDGLTGRDLAIAIYKDRTIGFIGDQVAKFHKEWSNFTKGSVTT